MYVHRNHRSIQFTIAIKLTSAAIAVVLDADVDWVVKVAAELLRLLLR